MIANSCSNDVDDVKDCAQWLKIGSTKVSNSLHCNAGSLMPSQAHRRRMANNAFLAAATRKPAPNAMFQTA